ncbi:dihydroorotase [Lachnospiraceae bacterium XBB1006]|nr:dihydroorotase [Lachnospiraceae bacterium XBB1006]
MRILIKNGRVLDPSCGRDEIANLWIADGQIADDQGVEEAVADKVIDATGCWVMPGLVDLHVHLRDPGLTYKETVETGCKAAIAGGYTTIFAMPNTKPVADSEDVIRYVEEKGDKTGIHVHQVGAITKGMEGKELAPLKQLSSAGAIAFSEDGKSVMDSGIYREAMIQTRQLGMPIFAHCEDKPLVQGGVMNMDEKAKELSLPGISNAVEDIIVARDLLLAKETGAQLHLCHCSTKDSVRMLRLAKREGLAVSGEACPHHFVLTSEDIPADDGNYKMNPPLRREADRAAIVEGLRDGTLGAIATDHAPHSDEEKNGSMLQAAFGIVGLETVVPLTITKLYREEKFPALRIAELLSTGPAKIAGILEGEGAGTLQPGTTADVTILDPEAKYRVDASKFASMGHNTPFHGMNVYGEVKYTICDGNILKGELIK